MARVKYPPTVRADAFYVHLGLALFKHTELRRLRSMGFHLLVIDDVGIAPPTDVYDDYVALPQPSAEQVQEAIEAYARKSQRRLAQVFTLAEGSITLVNEVCKRLGQRPIYHLDCGDIRNKYETRKRLEALGIRLPFLALIPSRSEIPSVNFSHFPLVVKPVASMESRSVSKVTSQAELEVACEKVFSERTVFQGNGGPVSVEDVYQCANHALIETCLPGVEYSTEVLVFDGKVRLRTVTRKSKVGFPKIYEVAQIVGDEPLTSNQLANLDRLVDSLIKANKYDSTILHIEFYAVPNGKVHLVECNSRMGGDRISTLIYEAYGIDYVAWMLHCLDEGRWVEVPLRRQKYASIFYLCTESRGKLERVAKKYREFPIEWTRENQDYIEPVATERNSRVGFIFLYSESLDALTTWIEDLHHRNNKLFHIV